MKKYMDEKVKKYIQNVVPYNTRMNPVKTDYVLSYK